MRQFFICPADDASQGGSGTATDPLRIHSPSHFDGVLDSLSHGALQDVHSLHLSSGVYETRGIWALPAFTIPNPLTIEGDAITRPTIRLSTDAIFETNGQPRPDTSVLRLGKANRSNHGFAVRNLIIDGNESKLPADRVVTTGLHIWSNNPQIEHLHVKGLRGALKHPMDGLDHEAFGILINNSAEGDSGTDGGGRIENVIIEDNGTPYFSGFYPGISRYSRSVLPTIARGVRVIGTGNTPSRLALSFQARTHYYQCGAVNTGYAFYNDTGVAEDAVAEDCSFDRLGYCALALSAYPATPSPRKTNIRIARCKFHYTPPPNADWIAAWMDDSRKTEAVITGIVMDDCEFTGSSAKPFHAGVFDAQRLGTVAISGLLPTGWVTKVTPGTPIDNVLIKSLA